MAEHARGLDRLPEKTLVEYLSVVWRRKWVLLLTIVVATGAVVGLDKARHPRYTSSAQLLFLPQGSGATSSAADNSLSSGQLATDMALVQSSEVVAEAAQLLHRAPPTASVSQIGQTSVASISVTSNDKEFAASAANAYANAYIAVETRAYLKSQLANERAIERQLAGVNKAIASLTLPSSSASTQSELSGLYSQQALLQQQLNALQVVTAESAAAGQIVQPAAASNVPTSPKTVDDMVIAAGVGLLVGIGAALLLDLLDDRVRGVDGLEAASGGLPAIGLVPSVADWRDRSSPLLVSAKRPRSPASEAYRTLRTSIQFMALERPLKLLQVTSCVAAEGKTTTASNLAYTMAAAGQRVVLIDCDLRRPRLHSFFGVPNVKGLTTVLSGSTTLEEALRAAPGTEHLLIFPSGPVPPNPAEILAGERAAKLFQALGESVDIVILDSSPVLPVTDAIALAARVDGVLLVTATGISTARAVARTLELLGRVDARIVGTVLNRAPQAGPYSYYRSPYGYGYGPAEPPTGAGTSNGTHEQNGRDRSKANGHIREHREPTET